MSKHLKLTIKNSQLAQAINLSGVKDKLAKNKEDTSEQKKDSKKSPAKEQEESEESSVKNIKEEAPRRARSKSVFAEGSQQKGTTSTSEEVVETQISEDQASTSHVYEEELETEVVEVKPLSEPKEEVFKEVTSKIEKETLKESSEPLEKEIVLETPKVEISTPKKTEVVPKKTEAAPPKIEPRREFSLFKREQAPPVARVHQPYEKLGPTGKHIKDLTPPKKAPPPPPSKPAEVKSRAEHPTQQRPTTETRSKVEVRSTETSTESKKVPLKSPREFRDVKNEKKVEPVRTFDARDRQGLRDNSEDEQRWRKRRYGKGMRSIKEEIPIVRPTSLKVRLPISIKDLAAEMKLKASQLIAKLFMQGLVVTLNDLLEDQTTVQLLGHEFGCEIEINTAEEERIRITDKKVKEEIATSPEKDLIIRPPVIAFMGHVDHGKTSLIDRIRLSNRAAGEAGAITQHIGAFCCKTAVGNITILDTPGHEAFSAMRARGADVTDIVVLVVAGDEGIRQQTVEAIQHALTANVNIVVAINKADKPGFNPENVYRQLAENNLLPEAWGGQILTVNCSAVTGVGIKELLEALALQAEILELKADPLARARGTVIESEMHKGMGYVATVLIQNGTLRIGDSLVFEQHWGRVKTMRNEFGKDILEAGPSTPVSITGLSGLPDAGQEFIVVKNEREAREISEKRVQGLRQISMQQRRPMTAEGLLQQTPATKKVLNLILRADVQGSLEALKIALKKIQSTKAELNIIYSGVGEILESDIELASGSKAIVLGFHTQVEGHAENLIRQLGVQVRLHKIIYHAIDDVKEVMTGLLDKIAQETNRGKVEVKTLFKSSQAGTIAGCMVLEGPVQRNHHVRIIRDGVQIGKAQIQSLRRNKDDVREVNKGMECGIVLSKGSDVKEGDVLEAYEITYITQEL